MFESMTVKSLKQLVSQYRQHHNIRGYSKMKKADLLTELEKRFVIHNNELFLKQNTHLTSPPPPATPQKEKKRITPILVSASPKKIPKQQSFQAPVQQSNAVKRALKKADELEEYYKSRGDKDEYPDLAF